MLCRAVGFCLSICVWYYVMVGGEGVKEGGRGGYFTKNLSCPNRTVNVNVEREDMKEIKVEDVCNVCMRVVLMAVRIAGQWQTGEQSNYEDAYVAPSLPRW